MITPLLLALLLSTAISLLAYQRRMLSRGGAAGALVLGTLTLRAGLAWALLLLLFFISSSLLSRVGEGRKAAARRQFSKGEQRDLAQVLANGGAAAIAAAGYLLLGNELFWFAYVGALAAATADTWATEIGTLSSSPPRLLTTGRRVAPGTSGAVTPLGLGATLAGACSLGLAAALLRGEGAAALAVGLSSGLAGSLGDSLLGATVQALYWCADAGRLTERATCADGTPAALRRGLPWMSNDAVNFLATALAALVGGLLGLML